VCECLALVPHTSDPDNPSSVVLDGIVTPGEEYGPMPTGYAQTSGVLRAAIYTIEDGGVMYIGALPVDAGAAIEDGFLEIDWDADGFGDWVVHVGGDVGDGGEPDAVLSLSPTGLEFRVPLNLRSCADGRRPCPHVAVYVKIADTDSSGRWPGSSAGGPYQCACGPDDCGGGDEGEAESEGEGDGTGDGDEGESEGGGIAPDGGFTPFGSSSSCGCRVAGAPYPGGLLAAPAALVVLLWRRRRR
jgi:MYXO-CTERM domain-containing protein